MSEKDVLNCAKVLSKQELWVWQAPSWNFELDADELLDKALELGFVTKISNDKYLINEEYKGKEEV